MKDEIPLLSQNTSELDQEMLLDKISYMEAKTNQIQTYYSELKYLKSELNKYTNKLADYEAMAENITQDNFENSKLIESLEGEIGQLENNVKEAGQKQNELKKQFNDKG